MYIQHTHIHTCTSVHACIHMHTCMHAHTNTHTHTQHTHTCTLARVHTHTQNSIIINMQEESVVKYSPFQLAKRKEMREAAQKELEKAEEAGELGNIKISLLKNGNEVGLPPSENLF